VNGPQTTGEVVDAGKGKADQTASPVHVVGIDPSLTATGIAYADGSTATVKYARGADGDQRLEEIYVATICAVEDRPQLAVVEDLPTHAHGAGKTGMAQGAVRLALIGNLVPYVVVTPATVKKYATGKGNATKPDMRMALYQRTGLDLRDDNQVDAWWLRALGCHLLGHPLLQVPKTHLEALDKVDFAQRVVA
jgi:Holliday junction resolvasome RuvABC endonuclease subunit